MYIYTCKYIYICIHKYTYIYIFIYRYIYIYIYIYVYAYICIFMYIHMCVYMYTNIYAYLHIYTYIYINKYIYIHHTSVYLYMHSHMHTCVAQNIKFDFLCLCVLEVARVRLHVKYASMRCTLFDFYFPPLESPAIYKHFYYYYFRRAKEEGKEQGTYTVCLRFVQVCQLLQNLALHIRHTHTRTYTHIHTHTHICVVDFYQIYEGAQIPHTKAHSTGTKK